MCARDMCVRFFGRGISETFSLLVKEFYTLIVIVKRQKIWGFFLVFQTLS
jgi:hypothetical protein